MCPHTAIRQVLEYEKSKAAEQCRSQAAQENAQESKELVARLRDKVRVCSRMLTYADVR